MKFPSYSVFFGSLCCICAKSQKYLLTKVLRSLSILLSLDLVVLREQKLGTCGKDNGLDIVLVNIFCQGIGYIFSSLVSLQNAFLSLIFLSFSYNLRFYRSISVFFYSIRRCFRLRCVKGFTKLFFVYRGIYFFYGTYGESYYYLGGDGARRGVKECVIPQFFLALDFMQNQQIYQDWNNQTFADCQCQSCIELQSNYAQLCKQTLMESTKIINYYQLSFYEYTLGNGKATTKDMVKYSYLPQRQGNSFQMMVKLLPTILN